MEPERVEGHFLGMIWWFDDLMNAPFFCSFVWAKRKWEMSPKESQEKDFADIFEAV